MLDESNVEAVVDICRQLDGIPLAIELAAARVRGMAPAEIARRLSERFRLLTASRGALERHRTLFGAVSWSHDLLTDEERRVFRRLAVFPASFDLAAAEAVASHDTAPVDVVDSVLRLVDRSLVIYDPAADRYRLLETLRQYGADRLAEAGETDAIRDRHSEHYLTVASKDAAPSEDPRLTASDRLAAELDNLRAVADWLARQGRWGDVLGLGRRLFWLFWSRAPLEGYRWYRSAMDHYPRPDGQERIDALGELDLLRMVSGGSSEDGLAAAGIALAEATGRLDSPWALFARSSALYSVDPPNARRAAEAALGVADERGDQLAAVCAMGVLVGAPASIGESGQSAEVAHEALRRARLLSHPDPLAVAVVCAATSYLTNRVEPDFQAGLQILETNPVNIEAASPGNTLWLRRVWGLGYLGLGRSDIAVQYLSRSVRQAEQIGFFGVIEAAALELAVALAEAGQPTLAAQLDGYAHAHFTSPTMRYANHAWMQARLDGLKDALGATEWATAAEVGTRMDRRGFIRLLTEAEQTVDPLRGGPSA